MTSKNENPVLIGKNGMPWISKYTVIGKNLPKKVQYCLKCLILLVSVPQLTDVDVKPAIGIAYEAMAMAKANQGYVSKSLGNYQ